MNQRIKQKFDELVAAKGFEKVVHISGPAVAKRVVDQMSIDEEIDRLRRSTWSPQKRRIMRAIENVRKARRT